MRFPNALKGIKIIHMAELVTLVLTVCSLGMLVLEQLLEDAERLEPFYWIILVLGLLALALELIGILTAAQDEPLFKTALTFVFVGIAASAISSFTSGAIANLAQTVSSVAGIFVTYYVIKGIIALAGKLGDSAIAQKGESVIKLILVKGDPFFDEL